MFPVIVEIIVSYNENNTNIIIYINHEIHCMQNKTKFS